MNSANGTFSTERVYSTLDEKHSTKTRHCEACGLRNLRAQKEIFLLISNKLTASFRINANLFVVM